MDILVADDSSAIQKVVRIAFKDSQFELEEVEDLDTFLNKVQTHNPKVILADPLLPGLDGPADLREIVGKTPTVLLVGTYDQINEAQWKQAGFPYIMKKPFDGRALVELVRNLMGHGSDHASSKSTKPAATPPISKLEINFLESGSVSPSLSMQPPLNQTEDRGKKAFSDLEFSQLNFAEFNSASTKTRASSAARSDDHMVTPTHNLPTAKKNEAKSVSSMPSPSPLDVAISKSLNEFDFNTPSASTPEQFRELDAVQQNSKQHHTSTAAVDMDALVAMIWPRIQELIRSEVRQYLDGQVKSQIPQIAKEVIMSEIRRLTDEKARIHVDR